MEEEQRKGMHIIIFTRALGGRGHGRMHKGKEEEIQERWRRCAKETRTGIQRKEKKDGGKGDWKTEKEEGRKKGKS